MPADLAMARLHDLLPRERTGIQRQSLYEVSSETLDDSIYFEVRAFSHDTHEAASYGRIATGQMSELDKTRTYVDCELPGSAFLPAISFGFALAFSGFIVLLVGRGALRPSEAIIFGVIAALAFVFAWLSSDRKYVRDLALEIIELSIQPREEDRNLIARRKSQHYRPISERLAYTIESGSVKRDIARHDRG